MKNLVFCLFIFFYLLSIASALDCSYTEPNYIEILKNYSYDGTEKFNYPLLEIREFIGEGNQNPYWSFIKTEAGFKVYNNHNRQIITTVFFTNKGNQENETLQIDSLGYKSVNKGTNGKLDYSSIRFEFNDSSLRMGIEKVLVENGSKCQMCGEKFCLNDGEKCFLDRECGSNICNSLNLCGKIRDVPCPDSQSLCNHKCLPREIKSFGDVALCEFECKSGFIENGKCKTCAGKECLKDGFKCEIPEECGSGACNPNKECGNFGGCKNESVFCNKTNTCLNESTKKAGEVYSCSFECKSDRWNEEKCLMKNSTRLLLISLLIIIVAIVVWYFAFKKRKREDIKKGQAIKERDKAKEESDIITKEIAKTKNILAKLELDKNNLINEVAQEKEKSQRRIKEIKDKEYKEIKNLEEKKKNKSKEAQKAIDEEITKIRKDRGKEIESAKMELSEILNSLNSDIEKNKKLRNEENKNLEEIKKIHEETKNLMLIPHTNKQRYKVTLDEEGYEIYNGERFHRFWYRKNYHLSKEEIRNFAIHHIDGDKRNNEIWNLIQLTHEEHNKIHIANRNWLNWKEGIEILQKNNLELPLFVLKKLKRKG